MTRRDLRTLLLTLILVASFVALRAEARPQAFFQIVAVDDLRASVSMVAGTIDRDLSIDVGFARMLHSAYPVACLTVFRDLRYKLAGPSGRVLPLHLPLPKPAAGCVKSKNFHSEQTVRLSQLFGRLPAGTYTLQITFAPHGVAQRATLRPVLVIVGG